MKKTPAAATTSAIALLPGSNAGKGGLKELAVNRVENVQHDRTPLYYPRESKHLRVSRWLHRPGKWFRPGLGWCWGFGSAPNRLTSLVTPGTRTGPATAPRLVPPCRRHLGKLLGLNAASKYPHVTNKRAKSNHDSNAVRLLAIPEISGRVCSWNRAAEIHGAG